MSWIESHQSLSRHRKTLKAARLLKCDKHKLIGHLHELWWWGLDNAADDGELPRIDLADIAFAAQWAGRVDAEAFGLVLIECGFVDTDEHQQTFWIHDWWDFAGKLNTQRELRKLSNKNSQRSHRQRLRQHHVSADIADSQHPTVPTNLTYRTKSTESARDNDGPEQPDVKAVFESYRATIQPAARLIDAAREKIRARLKVFSEADLLEAVRRFSQDEWEMAHNAHRGAAWFFHSDQRVEGYVNLQPRVERKPGTAMRVMDPSASFKAIEEWDQMHAAAEVLAS